MEIKLRSQGSTGELLFIGRLDSKTAPEVDKLLEQMVGRFENLVFNYEKLEYMSSAGIRLVLKTHKAMKKKGGGLTLKKVSPQIMEVFQLTGFISILNFEE